MTVLVKFIFIVSFSVTVFQCCLQPVLSLPVTPSANCIGIEKPLNCQQHVDKLEQLQKQTQNLQPDSADSDQKRQLPTTLSSVTSQVQISTEHISASNDAYRSNPISGTTSHSDEIAETSKHPPDHPPPPYYPYPPPRKHRSLSSIYSLFVMLWMFLVFLVICGPCCLCCLLPCVAIGDSMSGWDNWNSYTASWRGYAPVR
ncbi:hypothetical protein BKA69DRAFT_1071657 [Paraphysoderma sedebokerense]|nr:hypothetical protein BKA69DRAFT_1071657 [Paraphysoderma sedebokerense]